MKTLIFILISFASFSQVQVDKVAHLGIGYIAGTTTTLYLNAKGLPLHKSVPIACGVGGLLGLGKELYDHHKVQNFDSEDLFVTFMGGFLGSCTVAVYFGDVKVQKFKKYRL